MEKTLMAWVEIGKDKNDATNFVIVTEIRNGQVFYHRATDTSETLKSTPQSFNQKYERYGVQYQD